MKDAETTPEVDSERTSQQSHAGLHGHVHAHDGREHRHPHHHAGAVAREAQPRARSATRRALHDHAHALTFERFTYICSPVHDLDPRAKILAALLLISGIVLGPPPRLTEFALLFALLVSVTLLARLPMGAALARSLLVLPIAASIALFAPLARVDGGWSAHSVAEAYASGWPLSWSILSKAWLGAFTVILLAATTAPPLLFKGLTAMRVPLVFMTMLTFLYRFADVLRSQLGSMRRAVASRGAGIGGRRLVALYGNLAGALFIRSYERGERIHAAMRSRGYDGTLPSAEPLEFRVYDALVVVTALLAAAALLLY